MKHLPIGRLALFVSLIGVWTCGESSAPKGGTQTATPELLWRDSLVSSFAPPAVDDHAAYFLTPSHDVVAASKESGLVTWRTTLAVTTPDRSGFGLNFAGNKLVVGDIDLFGLDPSTGHIDWKYIPTSGRRPGFQHQATDGSTVFCGSVTGQVYAVDGSSGSEIWTTKVAPDTDVLVFDPVLDKGVIYVGYTNTTVGSAKEGGAAAIDATTGRLLWSRVLPQPNPSVPTGGFAGVAITLDYVVAPAADGYVYGLNRTTGDVRVTLPPSAFVSGQAPPQMEQRQISGNGQTVVIGSAWGWLSAWGGSDLHRLWIVTVNRGTSEDIAIADDVVFSAYLSGEFAAHSLSDGRRLWLLDRGSLRPDRQEGIISSPALDANRLYIGGEHEIYAFRK